MTEDRTVGVMLGGAVVGALAAYLFFTERGRALRRQIEPKLEDFAQELGRFRGDVQRAISVATEGWESPAGDRPGRTH